VDVQEAAKLFGLDPSSAGKGNAAGKTIVVQDIDTFRKLFGGELTDEQRQAFSAAAPDIEEHPPMGELIDHVFGAGELTDSAEAYSREVTPTEVTMVAGDTFTIDTDIVQGPSGQPYSIVTDNLVFDGGSLTMLATALTIQATSVTIKSGSQKNPYHIGIMGVVGATPEQAPSGAPYANSAQSGSNSSPPSPGICSGAKSGGTGKNGAKGNPGAAGYPGNQGVASYPATIAIKSFDASSTTGLVVQTQSGAGGIGGQGGNGGPGQNGGNGGKGCDSGCEGTNGGNGGNAGAGGDGGPGGTGADGINGYPISISFPSAAKQMLQTVSVAAPAGPGGKGGAGGPPGSPGKGGDGGKGKSDGKSGSGASGGAAGATGTAGANPGAPGQISIAWT